MEEAGVRAAVLAAIMIAPTALGLGGNAAEDPVPLYGSVAPFAAWAPVVGDADPAEAIDFLVVLRLQDVEALAAHVDSGAAPLPREEVVARFSPSQATLARVIAWLASEGVVVADVSEDRTLVRVQTTVATAEAAFGVDLRRYQLGDDVVRAHTEPPLVPAALASDLLALVGLAEVPLRTFHIASPDDGLRPLENGSPPFGVFDLRNAYEVNGALSAGHDGGGRVAAITSWGSASQTSLNEYSSFYGIASTTLTHVDSSGGSSCPGNDLEWDLDVQMQHALSPGATIRVYCGSAANTAAMLSAVDRAVTQNVADVVSQSWGTCDANVSSGTASSYESKFLQAAAQGMAFFTASGDSGSRECTRSNPSNTVLSPSWPATAPHTTSVAGTRLTMSGTSYSSESTWNTCAPCPGQAWSASGGGPSLLYSKPSWQTAPPGATMRGSGDVSAVADPATGVRVRNGGGWWQVGGTSVSSPVVSGMWLDIVDAHGRLGNAGEKLWPLLGNGAVLRDVTTGHNGDHAAGVGYDYPTGLGSPRLTALLAELSPTAPPTNLQAIGGDRSVSLSWTASPGADAYRVWRGTSPTALSLVAQLGAVTSHVDGGLADGTTYHYAVSAVKSGSESARTPVLAATTFGIPGAPLGVSVAQAGAQLALSWSPPTSDGGAAISAYRAYGADVIGTTPRLVGGELFLYAMDAADHDVPSAGKTRDAAGTRHGTITGATPVGGAHGDGLLFRGVQDRVNVPLSGVSIAQGTLTMWVRPDGYGPAESNLLFYHQRPGVSNHLALRLDGTAQNLVHFQLHHTRPTLVGTADLPLGEWTHVAVTWGPGGQRIYVNGVLDASNGDTTTVTNGYTHTMIGNSPNDVANRGFEGAIDDVREIATQLDAATIQSMMASPMSPVLGPSVLLAETTATSMGDPAPANAPRSYHVRAVNVYGEGPASSAALGVRESQEDDAPSGLAVWATAPGTLSLAWAPPANPSAPLVGYRILRGTSVLDLAPLADIGLVTEHSDGGLPPDATRLYQVQALTQAGAEGRSLVASGTTPTPPRSSLASLQASAGPAVGAIGLAWDPPADDGGLAVTGYRIYSAPAGQPLALLATTGPQTGYAHTGLPPNATRAYAVSAMNAVGEGPLSPQRIATTFALPGRPLDFAVVRGPGVGEVGVSWRAPDFDGGRPVTSYRVFRGTSPSSMPLLAETTQTSLLDSGLPENSTFHYAVQAVTEVGASTSTASLAATTFGRPYAPTIGAQTVQGGALRVTWTPPPDGGLPVTSYAVYAGNSSADKSLVAVVTDTRYEESGFAPGTVRYYQVSATNAVGEGPQSAERSAQAYSNPTPPTSLTITRPTGTAITQLILRWNAPGNANAAAVYGYKVYRAVDGAAMAEYATILNPNVRQYQDELCPIARRCSYEVTALGIVRESGPSNRVSELGLSPFAP